LPHSTGRIRRKTRVYSPHAPTPYICDPAPARGPWGVLTHSRTRSVLTHSRKPTYSIPPHTYTCARSMVRASPSTSLSASTFFSSDASSSFRSLFKNRQGQHLPNQKTATTHMGENHQSFAQQVPVTQAFTQVTCRRYKPPISSVKHPQGPPPNPNSHPVHLITKAGQTEQLCGPLSLRPSSTPPPRRRVGKHALRGELPLPPPRPPRCDARKSPPVPPRSDR